MVSSPKEFHKIDEHTIGKAQIPMHHHWKEKSL
jgi:hypothetical protein